MTHFCIALVVQYRSLLSHWVHMALAGLSRPSGQTDGADGASDTEQPLLSTGDGNQQEKKKKKTQQGRQGALTLTHWSGPTPLTVMVVSGLSSRTFSLQHLASSLVQTLMGTIQLGHSSPGRQHTHQSEEATAGGTQAGDRVGISFCSVQWVSFTNLCILFMCCVLTLCSVSLSFYLLPGSFFLFQLPLNAPPI